MVGNHRLAFSEYQFFNFILCQILKNAKIHYVSAKALRLV